VETTNQTLEGRIALVTGSGRGIGRAVAVGLAAVGAKVAVLARSADQVQQTAALAGRGVLAIPADVTDTGQVAAGLDAIRGRWGPVEVLVNSSLTRPAGICSPPASCSTPPAA
jgi:NAD(P)-dependent dehydrogenase (short-subunit alcohol dehydrogenase family)